ncbi:MAG: rhodanese-like domain-containing protein [Saprospiraceae bacterium]|nr:rhodanese-like domain-containing protein [Saprospiraceae bacterium]
MTDITVQELKQKIDQKENFILIDVRETYEHAEFNIGGELASLQTTLPLKIKELENQKDQEIVVYCRSGNRSGMAKQMFLQAGFNNVRNLIGGMLQWQEVYKS